MACQGAVHPAHACLQDAPRVRQRRTLLSGTAVLRCCSSQACGGYMRGVQSIVAMRDACAQASEAVPDRARHGLGEPEAHRGAGPQLQAAQDALQGRHGPAPAAAPGPRPGEAPDQKYHHVLVAPVQRHAVCTHQCCPARTPNYSTAEAALAIRGHHHVACGHGSPPATLDPVIFTTT